MNKGKLTLSMSALALLLGISGPVFAGGGGPPPPDKCAHLQNIQSGAFANYIAVSNNCPYRVVLNYYDSLDRRWKAKGALGTTTHSKPYYFYVGSFVSQYNFQKAN
ncbi:hypothetical protein [Enterovibrio paralichthyis]|uniref:hypothetical protein n=1 Tax=Enterovibrio paralichthyis TaxID=2853805 RepID=UPI001C479C40|nr:hypothetical protein [Enterovibrio paralichthyis]MBV7297252.1 hypothetical protein [Enterovibrio paralichthyis]